jgi:protein arginine N-methyltransferase 1
VITSESELSTPHRGYPADVIPLQYHAQMLLDEPRMRGFQEAIAATVHPGMHVLDLGAGTGILSFFAAQRGARVTAVEREPGVLAAAEVSLAVAPKDMVHLVHGDARDYLPEHPVDVVLCEMMHVGQFRERQIEVIGSFKRRYVERFGDRLPRFIPEACVQATQPVEQDFGYFGYTVAAPVFQQPSAIQPRTVEVAEPQVYQQFFYRDPLPDRCHADLRFTTTRAGRVNALRVITKNLLAIQFAPPGSIDWLMAYLVVPLREPVRVRAGEELRIAFDYRPGDEISALTDGLRMTASPTVP